MLLVVGLIAFSLFRYVGDPVNGMVGQDTPAREREALREKLGLNDPAPVQFLRFIGNAAQRQVRPRYRTSEPVNRMILERLPATLELRFCAALFALLVGMPMGVYTGLYPTALEQPRCLQAVSLVGVSLPTFLIGILLILVFAVCCGWLPSFGRGETRAARLVDHRLPDARTGMQGADPAGDHARPVPADADHAAGALRDARGAAHRLHQVRARPRPHQPRDQFRPRAEEHAGAGDHHHRPAARRASSPSRSSPRRCSSGPAWACSSSRRCSSPTSR